MHNMVIILSNKINKELVTHYNEINELKKYVEDLLSSVPNADDNSQNLKETWTSLDDCLRHLNYALTAIQGVE